MAVQQPTGQMLAVVERTDDEDRALQGEFPLGSTFKIVTAAALTKGGCAYRVSLRVPYHWQSFRCPDGPAVHTRFLALVRP